MASGVTTPSPAPGCATGGGVNAKDRIASFVNELVSISSMEEAFNMFLVHRADLDSANRERELSDWICLLKELPPGETETAIRTFVQVSPTVSTCHFHCQSQLVAVVEAYFVMVLTCAILLRIRYDSRQQRNQTQFFRKTSGRHWVAVS